MTVQQAPVALTAKDLTSDQEVRWCPGCGDYAIIKGVRNALAEIGTPREKTVFVSGIGCAARFPYYMATYGFHTIHGRAPAFATGLKLVNPDLDVWVVTGDGDCLSIGGNHTLHVLRRNVDVNVMLFNNAIYGLTKGQYSPTSRVGTKSPSTPLGSIDNPVSAIEFALGSGARFVARSIDTLQKHLPVVLKRAHAHKGASFIEIFQNCIVYNDGAFAQFTDRSIAADTQVHLEHGKPVLFGKDNDKGIRLNTSTLQLEVVKIGENGITEADVLVHDEKNKVLATLLAQMQPPALPVALGVIYCEDGPEYVSAVEDQVEAAKAKKKPVPMAELLHSGHTWRVGI
jgi:2-oxoglutarate ferredoxin oxidoreductase subunit beta